MDRAQKVLKNSTISVLSQITTLVITLITRKVFIQYLGAEILGLNNTFISLINTLSLAELGFQTAVVYHLYKPLATKNETEINDLINIYKTVFRLVALFIGCASLICIPLLPFVLKGIVMEKIIYLYFFLQVGNTMVSYLLAYKRALIYADQREYISKLVDLICNILFSGAKIVVILLFKSFTLFLVVQILQTAISNIIVHRICRRLYPYLKADNMNKELFKKTFDNVKNVFASKVAFYINYSTDNLVISVIVGTLSVAYFTNYTTITSNIKKLVVSFFSPIAPIIGGMLAEQSTDCEEKKEVLFLYTHVGFVFSLFLLIPTQILLSDFIGAFYGSEYILSTTIVSLLTFDLYIHFVHRVCCDYINGAGLFKYDKYIEMIGALLNIVVSILLARKMGVVGVLIGTALSGILFWIGRSFVVFKYCIQTSGTYYWNYWLKNIYAMLVFVGATILCRFVYSKIYCNIFIAQFLVGGIMIEMLCLCIYFICFSRTKEFQELKKSLLKLIGKRRNKGEGEGV